MILVETLNFVSKNLVTISERIKEKKADAIQMKDINLKKIKPYSLASTKCFGNDDQREKLK